MANPFEGDSRAQAACMGCYPNFPASGDNAKLLFSRSNEICADLISY